MMGLFFNIWTVLLTNKTFLFICLLCLYSTGFCEPSTKDQALKAITLAPHLAELVYSAGGANHLYGVSAYSNFPESVKEKPIIGDAFHLNLELIKQIDPDIIFYWKNSTPQQTIDQLNRMQYKLVGIEINELNDIPEAIKQIAQILETNFNTHTALFDQKLKRLKSTTKRYKSTLIQISDQPIYTVNGKHWMSEAINVCGLENVYADLTRESAAVTLESVVLKSPEVIIRISELDDSNQLNKWHSIPAITNNHIITLDADHFTRPTLRTLLAIESMCEQIKKFDSTN